MNTFVVNVAPTKGCGPLLPQGKVLRFKTYFLYMCRSIDLPAKEGFGYCMSTCILLGHQQY